MAWSQPSQGDPKTIPGPRAAHSSDLIRNKLYVFGGWNGKKALNDLHILDVDLMTWEEQSPGGTSPSTRNNHISVVVARTKIFVHGGHDGGKWLNDLHILDTERLCWVTPNVAGECPPARACHSLTHVSTDFGRRLVMFGGYDGCRCFNDVDVLDLDTMTWRQPTVTGSVPQSRNAHTMTAVAEKLYLFGGHSGNKHLRDVHILDADTMQWSQPQVNGIPPPGLRGHSASLIGHLAFMFGGYDGRGRSNELHVLNLETLSWTHPDRNDQTPSGRQRHSASLVGANRLIFFGGFDGFKWLNDLHVLDVGNLEASNISKAAETHLIGNMRRLLNNQELFSDVTFIVDEKPIHAHKAILAAQCDQFSAMFTSGMRESTESEIRIQGGWSYAAFLAMLEFLYTGSVEHFDAELALDLVGLADQFTLDHLKRLCENLLVHHVDVDNVCGLLSCAHRYTAPDLKKICLNFIIKHFHSVQASSGFEALSQEPQLLLEVTRESMARASR